MTKVAQPKAWSFFSWPDGSRRSWPQGGGTPGTLPALTLTPSQTNASGPWTFGHAFKKGDVPQGFYLTTSSGTSSFQAQVRNRWSDGSVKFAVLSGISPFTVGTAHTVQLATTATAPTGTNVAEPTTLANTKIVFTPASGQFPISATVTCDINSVLGVAQGTWGTSTAGRVRSILGPVMSEFHYFQPTGQGQLAVWWYVRKYSTGAVEVEYEVENGWLQAASPSQVDYAVTATIGGTQVYTTAHIASDMPVRTITGSTSTSFVYGDDVRPQLLVGGYFYVNGDPSTIFQATAVTSTTISCAGGLPTVMSFSVLGHFAHSRWGGVAWASGGAPVTPAHDPVYLRATKLVPNYGYTSPTSAAYTGLASALNPSPFALGDWTFHMGDVGAQGSIGLLPTWEALYCATGDSRAYAATISDVRGAGRWSIHYRDETTGRIPDPRSYTTKALSQDGWGTIPAGSGGSQGGWNISHGVSSGYLAYLIEGRWSFLEECQYAGMFCILDSKPTNRTTNGYQAALVSSSPLTTRGIAWGFRCVIQAASASPTALDNGNTLASADQLQQAFAKCVDDTANFTYANFITGTINAGGWKNNLGWIKFSYDDNYAGETVNGGAGTIPLNSVFWGAAWMFGFQGMALGHAVELGIENLQAGNVLAVVLNFNAHHATLSMGIDNTYWNYRRGGVFNRPYTADYTSTPPVFLTQQQAFSDYVTTAALNPTLSAALGNTLKDHDSDNDATTSDTSNTGYGFWSLHLSTLALAGDAGAPGCRAALEMVKTAPNAAPDVTLTSNSPQFGIVPRNSPTKPAWRTALAPLTWTQFPNTDALNQVMTYPNPGTGSSSKREICSFSGAAYDDVHDQLLVFGGGHADYGGNETLALPINQAVPAWKLLRPPTQGVGDPTAQSPLQGNAYYTDGTPSSAHSYGQLQFSALFNRLMRFGATAVYGNGNGNYATVDGFSLDTNTWDPAGTWPIPESTFVHTVCTTVKDYLGNIWHCGNTNGKLYRFNIADKTWTIFAATGTPGGTINGEMAFVYDWKRHIIFRFPLVSGTTTVAGYYDLSTANAQFTQVTLSDPGGFATSLDNCCPTYCPDRDSYLFMPKQQSSVFECNATTLAVSPLTVSGAAPTVTLDGTGDFYQRFTYVPSLGGCLLMASATANVGFFGTR